jgi:glycosyltransferase involved in cell wall biosynthesis
MKAYVLATPVFNELEALPGLLESLEAQTVRPAVWVLVDDGSTDGSRAWLEQHAADRPWLVVLSSPEAANEYLGAHVARIKRWGLERALELATEQGVEVGYGGILDADLLPPPHHYERLIREFEGDPRLGVTSSVIQVVGSEAVESYQRDDLPRGGTQFFRLECLRDIDGIPPWPGFDGAANVKARLRGWSTRLVPDLVTFHRRETGTRYGAREGYLRKGRYAYFLGVHPLLVAGRALAYSRHAPYDRGLYFLQGWLGDVMRRSERCPDQEVRRQYGTARLLEVTRYTARRWLDRLRG